MSKVMPLLKAFQMLISPVTKIGIPFDSEKPMITSGIRLGTQAATTRGFGLKEFEKVGELITKVVKGLSENP